MESNARPITPLEQMLADKLYYFGSIGRHDYDMALTCAIHDAKQVRKQVLADEYIIKPQDCSNDICAEAVLPYICKERDKAQKKAECLEGYARGLEIRIEELTAKLEDATAALDAVQNKQLKDEALKLTTNQRKQTRLLLKQAVNALSQIENFVRTDG